MTPLAFWRALRRRLSRTAAPRARRSRLGGGRTRPPQDAASMQQVVDTAARQLGVRLELDAAAATASPRPAPLRRPAGPTPPPAPGRQDAEQHARERDRQTQQRLLEQAWRGWRLRDTPPLHAGYGAGAQLQLDFRARLAWVDPIAQQQLRACREMPRPADASPARLDALLRELDETLWDLGIAGSALPLLAAPDDWWHVPLRWRAGADASRYTRVPLQLDMARRLAERSMSPHDLRHHARASTQDLRRFLQASLLLGLAEWEGTPALPDLAAGPDRADTPAPAPATPWEAGAVLRTAWFRWARRWIDPRAHSLADRPEDRPTDAPAATRRDPRRPLLPL